jgi:hypothetical protein
LLRRERAGEIFIGEDELARGMTAYVVQAYDERRAHEGHAAH